MQEEWRAPTLIERLRLLISRSEAAIALPGGPGTLTEIALYWNHLVIQAIPRRPLVLIGSEWQQAFAVLFAAQARHIAPVHRALLRFVTNEEEAVAALGLP